MLPLVELWMRTSAMTPPSRWMTSLVRTVFTGRDQPAFPGYHPHGEIEEPVPGLVVLCLGPPRLLFGSALRPEHASMPPAPVQVTAAPPPTMRFCHQDLPSVDAR